MDGDQQPQSQNTTAATGYDPAAIPIPPAGYDETSGAPFWVIQGQRLDVVGVQRWLTSLQQQNTGTATGKGIEAMPQMVTIPKAPELQPVPEQREIVQMPQQPKPLEQADAKLEQQTAITNPTSTAPATAQAPVVNQDENLDIKFSAGPDVAIASKSAAQVTDFIAKNEKAPPADSRSFLAVLMKKVLQVLALS